MPRIRPADRLSASAQNPAPPPARRRPTRPAPALCALILAALPLASGPARASNEVAMPSVRAGQIEFNMPSLNVGCLYTPANHTGPYGTPDGGEELFCSRIEPEYLNARMSRTGRAVGPFASGEVPGLPVAPVLPYGRFWQAGGFSCLSTLRGLVCTNASGNGMMLSRSRIDTW